MEEIVNRVANSDIITLDLEDYFQAGDRIQIDIKQNLFQGMVLREKDFRDYIKQTDWSKYKGTFVAVHCSEEAIIPTWAYMLLTSNLEPFASGIVYGDLKALEQYLFQESLSKIDAKEYEGKKIIIKGCGHIPIPEFAFVELTRILRPYAYSIMYGEPCSMVPIFKRSGSKSSS